MDIDYSKSIMEILEAHLSPEPTLGVTPRASGKRLESGLNSDVDAAISEAGMEIKRETSRREVSRRIRAERRYKG